MWLEKNNEGWGSITILRVNLKNACKTFFSSAFFFPASEFSNGSKMVSHGGRRRHPYQYYCTSSLSAQNGMQNMSLRIVERLYQAQIQKPKVSFVGSFIGSSCDGTSMRSEKEEKGCRSRYTGIWVTCMWYSSPGCGGMNGRNGISLQV